MIRVSRNRRFLVRDDGSPFFYLADTGWCLFHRLTLDEATHYLRTRAQQGFTVIQAVVLAEHGGLEVPAACGHREFHDNDPTRPNDAYFDHVAAVLGVAESLGLVVGLLPTWGDKVGVNYWGAGPAQFINEDNAEGFGAYLGGRFAERDLIWILGGDRPGDGNKAIWRSMARGIKSSGASQLMSYHPKGGGESSSFWFHGDDWLDFNMIQSSHERFFPNWRCVVSDYSRTPVKPTLDGEPWYEDHPSGFSLSGGYASDHDVRMHAYWAVFAGAFGHTYGCHSVWQFYNPDSDFLVVNHPRTRWPDAITLPGSRQMVYLRRLMESRPFLTRIPDQNLIRDGQRFDHAHVRVTRDGTEGERDASYVMVYFPFHTTVTIGLAVLPDRLHLWWLRPSNGTAVDGGTMDNPGELRLSPPSDVVGEDWVAVFDDASLGRGAPGSGDPS